ncbi:tyrosine-type recombinase/integrase [Alicycliphilus sp. T452]
MFVASEASSRSGRASWILCYRFGGRQKEKVLGRYPDISLKEAREIALRDRALIQQGVDVAALKRREKLKARETHNVSSLARLWYEREIEPRYKHPENVERVIRRHIKPAIGRLPVDEIRPIHIDDVLTRIVSAGAPTVANDGLVALGCIAFRYGHTCSSQTKNACCQHALKLPQKTEGVACTRSSRRFALRHQSRWKLPISLGKVPRTTRQCIRPYAPLHTGAASPRSPSELVVGLVNLSTGRRVNFIDAAPHCCFAAAMRWQRSASSSRAPSWLPVGMCGACC